MGRVRTFLAVDVGGVTRSAAVALQKRLAKSGAGVKWVSPENLHVTLLFLGEVDERDLVGVCRAAARVAAAEPPFVMRAAGVGAFPNARRPKVVWAGITDGTDSLRRLHSSLELAMLDLGCYRVEERNYNPHLTLGRVNAEADSHSLAADLSSCSGWDGGLTAVSDVIVMSSDLRRDGPAYAILGRCPLRSSGVDRDIVR